jgi:nucleoside-diphosphate-sugar epimerase
MRAASRWVAEGSRVCAVTRYSEKCCALLASGFEPFVADIMVPKSLKGLPQADTVLFAVGYDRGSGHSIRQLYVDGLRIVLDHLPAQITRFIYVSSTGVYGQSDDAWVDEQSPCEPTRDGGRACWQAEQMLCSDRLGRQAIILRMAGIYGPGRIPRRKELRAGVPIEAPSEGYLNLIHVDDAASAVIAAEQQAPLPALYCVSDGDPVVRGEYFRELAALLGAPEPQFREPRPGTQAAERASASKRVSNRRMLTELKFDLLYPSYREGLAAIVREENKHQASRPSSRK